MTKHSHGKPGYTGIKRVVKATRYSLQGLKAAFQYEAAFRQEIVLLLIATLVSCLINVSTLEHIALIGVVVLVVIVELLNSAIEAIVDRIGSEHHELSGRAKDIGSAAVFVALVFAAFTWFYILVS